MIEIADSRKGKHFQGSKVTINGIEVGDVCLRAERYSDGSGRVTITLRDKQGSPFMFRGGLATVEVSGEVAITPPTSVTPEQYAAAQSRWLKA